MKRTHAGLVFCALLLLTGCAAADGGKSLPLVAAQPAAPAAGAITAQNETSLYLDIIDGLIKQGRPGASLAFLDSYATAQKQPEPRYWLLRGDALIGLGRYPEAAIAYVRLDGSPLAAAGWNGRGRAAASLSRWDEAVGDFQKAVAAGPSDPDFLNNLAFADMRLGRSAAAAACLRQAHELRPQSSLIRNNLVIALTMSGDREGAEAVLEGIKDAGERRDVEDMVRRAVARNGVVGEGKS